MGHGFHSELLVYQRVIQTNFDTPAAQDHDAGLCGGTGPETAVSCGTHGTIGFLALLARADRTILGKATGV